MQMRVFITWVCAWCIIWSAGGWLFGRYETGKDFSWLIGMPFYLPALVAVWGVVKGMKRFGVYGGPIGLIVGGLVGGLCYLPFMAIGSLSNGLALRNHPAWVSVETIWAFAGLVCGILCGGTVSLLSGLIGKICTSFQSDEEDESNRSNRGHC